jgi:hypothetical protein
MDPQGFDHQRLAAARCSEMRTALLPGASRSTSMGTTLPSPRAGT